MAEAVRPVGSRPASTRSELRRIVASMRYRQLLATRLTSQTGDGLFQAGLASLVLFNPEQQATPLLVAGVLAVAVLPFTIVGPFAGVLLDRWPRQRVLAIANLVRAAVATLCVTVVVGAGADVLTSPWVAVLYGLVLTALTVNRFLLAGLGSSLPHAVTPDLLVTANSITPTAGTAAFAVGFAGGGAWRAFVGGGTGTDATLLGAAAVAWLTAAAIASRIPRDGLGPDAPSQATAAQAARAVVAGLREGAAHVWRRPRPRNALAAMAAHRFAFGVLTIVTVVLAREYLTDDTDAALGVLVAVGAAAGAGALLAAVVTAPVTRALGRQSDTGALSNRGLDAWLVTCLGLAAVAVTVPAVRISTVVLVVVGFVVALAGQGVKICVDTMVQTGVDDQIRGRAFAFYDVSYNAAFVAAAALAALVVPADGYSRWLFVAVTGWYATAAVLYAVSRRAPAPEAH